MFHSADYMKWENGHMTHAGRVSFADRYTKVVLTVISPVILEHPDRVADDFQNRYRAPVLSLTHNTRPYLCRHAKLDPPHALAMAKLLDRMPHNDSLWPPAHSMPLQGQSMTERIGRHQSTIGSTTIG